MANFAEPQIQAPANGAPSLGRLRLAIYGLAVLAAAALWLLPSWLASPDEQSNSTSTAGTPGVNAAALGNLSRDLESWSKLLRDPRLDSLQAPAELRPSQPSNPSPFLREVAPSQQQ